MLLLLVATTVWSIRGAVAGGAPHVDDPASGLTVDWAASGADGEIVALAPTPMRVGRTVATAHLLAIGVFVLASLSRRKLRVQRPDPVIEARSPFIGAPAGSRAPPFCVVV